MKLKSRTPAVAAAYRPASADERAAEINKRNTAGLIRYFARNVRHELGQANAAQRRRLHLAAAFMARRQGGLRA